MQSKVQAKIEQIARLRVSGMKDARVAQIVGLSYGGLTRIVALDEYKQVEEMVRKELCGQMDAVLTETRVEDMRMQAMKKELADAVPEALQFIIDTARKGQDLRARFAASKEILDRDPKRLFTKQSRVEQPASPSAAGLPDGVLATARSESDKASEILSKVPVTKVAEA